MLTDETVKVIEGGRKGVGVVAGTFNVSIPADILFSSDSMQLHFSSTILAERKGGKKAKLAVLLFPPCDVAQRSAALADLSPRRRLPVLDLLLAHHRTLCWDWDDSRVEGSRGSLKSHTALYHL